MPGSCIDKLIAQRVQSNGLTFGNQVQTTDQNHAVTPRLSNQEPNRQRKSLSCKNYSIKRCFMRRHQTRHAQAHEELTEDMHRKIAMLEAQLAAALGVQQPDLQKKQLIVSTKCRLWVLKGALEHGFDFRVLAKISDQYEKIGTVPTGYFYPLLFQ